MTKSIISKENLRMGANFENAYREICESIKGHSVGVDDQSFEADKAGEFNGLQIVMNRNYDLEERLYYLIHAFGSIVGWSLNKCAVQVVFDTLDQAKQSRDSHRLENAIGPYRDFENTSSRYAVWLLVELGQAEIVPAYTNFMRADLESLTQFHRRGQAPIWRDYFAQWNRDVSAARRTVLPFEPLKIPAFVPERIEVQEILQEQPE